MRNNVFKLILVTVFGLFIVNCGGFQAPTTSYQDPRKGQSVSIEPSVQEGQGSKALQEIRKIVAFSNPKVSVSLEKKEVEFSVTTRWGDRTENIVLKGRLNEEDMSWLTDSHPTKAGKHQLKGVAKCLPREDNQRCAELFVDIYYAIKGVVYREQFSLDEPVLSAKVKEVIKTKPTQAGDDEKDYDENEESTEITPEDHGDEDERFDGGLYVSPTPSKEFLQDLYNRLSETAKAQNEGLVERVESSASNQSLDLNSPPASSGEAAPTQEATKPDPASAGTQGKEATDAAKKSTPAESTAGAIEPTPSSESDTELVMEDILSEDTVVENEIRYELNYTEGGRSVRFPWSGQIAQGGTVMPKQGPGFIRLGSEAKSVGSGFTVSLIDKASADFIAQNPTCGPLLLNQMSKNNGGLLKFDRPASNGQVAHASHQNGTEADVGYMPNQSFRSVLGRKGIISPSFNYDCNYGFWKHLYRIQLKDKGTALSRIFVHRNVKKGLCTWIKNKTVTAEDKEVLRRVQPIAGHYKHFHLRLNCSPDHIGCKNDLNIPKDNGCGL